MKKVFLIILISTLLVTTGWINAKEYDAGKEGSKCKEK